ncbi:transcriptional regulator [Limnohabitans sp. JirII-29]|uniref:transcriptional regulator n=1 Tax=Limnohabitans sp. JirII-29 TaxID=1835756 RepID=UPI000D3C9A24|nr:transcriptional regulator [Limnohabitans sp. JirII-29]PUE24119.1 transcriptional regulator [Limnohabitans sp. JirII-29]
MIKPIMGIKTNDSLANALFPKVRQRVLSVLFSTPDRSFYANEVISLAQSGTGAVQRELANLAQAGLITVTKLGNQKHFQANAQSPLYAELRSLVLKTVGLADVLRNALAPMAAGIRSAFVYGSMANQQDTAKSDVDVLLVSQTLSYADVFAALESASQQLKRNINPTLYTPDEFAQRLDQDQAFITRVMNQPKIWLIGQLEQKNGQQRT